MLNREVEGEPRFPPGKPGLEKTLLLLLLALDAMASPGDGFPAFHLDFFVTGHAQAIRAVLEALQGLVYQLQHATVVIALVKEKFLGVGIGRLVSDILRGFRVRLPSVVFRFRNQAQQLILLGQ